MNKKISIQFNQKEIECQAAAFRQLLEHLRKRTDVQNIDLMNLAGFCRNCLSGWYQDAATEKDIPLSKEEARAIIYGMPYSEWKKIIKLKMKSKVRKIINRKRVFKYA